MVDTESHARAIVGSTSQPIRDALLPDDTVCVGLFLSLQVDRVAPAGERWRTIIGRVLSAAPAASAIIRNRPRTRSDRRNWKPSVIITLGESFFSAKAAGGTATATDRSSTGRTDRAYVGG